MAKKTKKYADGGDVYEGTDLARSMGVRGVPEPGLEELHPEQYMGGVGSIRGVGGSAAKAVEESMIRKAQEKAFNRANRFATGKIRQYSPEEKNALAQQLNANVAKLNPANVTDTGLPSSVGQRLSTQARQPLTGDIGGSGGLSDIGAGPDYKKGGAVKAKSKPKASSASRRADGIAQRGKTKGKWC